jgi:hypothetical protein
MQFSAIPAELRALPQWTVWKPQINSGGKITKPPFRADQPTIPASSTDPSTWSTFEKAVATYEANRSVLGGIGFMLSASDPYVVWDVDDGAAVTDPHYARMRSEMVAAMLALGSYAETSPSGQGLHVWARGSIPVAGRKITVLDIEVYASARFMTCTGQPVHGSGDRVVDGQELLREMGLCQATPEVVLANDHERPCDLDDDVVMAQCWTGASFRERWQRTVWGDPPNDWSKGFVEVLRMLDRYSGSVEQVRRLALSSPMVKGSPPAANGEARWAKAERIFPNELRRVRAYASGDTYHRDHGEAVWLAICAESERRAQVRAEAVRKAVESSGRLSSQAAALLDLFPDLALDEQRLLQLPPGMVGEFVQACDRASHAPYLKFAIPATLATLSGITARRYKTATGSGTNVNYILAAPSSTGKTQSMHAWTGFLHAAVSGMPVTGAGVPRQRILNNGTSSIQGIMPDLEESPSCAWFIEECQAQLSGMSNPKGAVESALRDSYNQMYDCGKHGQMFSAPRSVASRNANIQPIPNLSVSTYWTTTTSKFDVFTDDALDGFLSRVVIIRHKGRAGDLQRVTQPLPAHLLDRLRLLLSYADSLDKDYRDAGPGNQGALNAPNGPGSKLIYVDDTYVRDLDWRLVEQCEVVKNASLSGDLPPTYTAISRLPQTAMRIACTLAVVENPNAPSVTEAQLRWAFGYLLQNLVSLLSDMDSGELGHVAGDEEAAVVRAVKELMGKRVSGADQQHGVPRNVLLQRLKADKVFARPGQSRSKAITSTLDHMVAEGATEQHTPSTGKAGRPTCYILPVLDHPLWKLLA